MLNRNRSGRRRRLLRTLAVILVAFALWRLTGPGLAIVRSDSLAPVLQPGDVVWVGRTRGLPPRGSVVLIEAPVSDDAWLPARLLDAMRERLSGGERAAAEQADAPDAMVPRIVAALPGDRVSWNDRSISIRTDSGELIRHAPRPVHPDLSQAVRRRRVPDDRLFLIGMGPGLIDSRIAGPLPASTVRRMVRRIVWPAERRGLVEPVGGSGP